MLPSSGPEDSDLPTGCGCRTSTAPQHIGQFPNVENFIGDSAYLFPDRRDNLLASRLVQYYGRLGPITTGPVTPLTTLDARRHALEALKSRSDVDALCWKTPFVQISNNIRDSLADSNELPQTPTRTYIASRLSLGAGDRLLDAGCSTGAYMRGFSSSGAQLIGVDLSMFALEVGREVWSRSHATQQPRWCAADVLALPVESSSCSHVMSTVVLSLVPIASALREIRRVLRPGGTLLFTIEGPGFIKEQAELVPLFNLRQLAFARWWLGHKLIQSGIDWQGRKIAGRLAGMTTYAPQGIRRILGAAGFRIDDLTVLARWGGRERLLGVVARKS